MGKVGGFLKICILGHLKYLMEGDALLRIKQFCTWRPPSTSFLACIMCNNVVIRDVCLYCHFSSLMLRNCVV